MQATALRDAWSELGEKAVIFGVSPDSIRSHKNFVAKKDLPFGLISDPEHKLAEALGMWVEKNTFGKKYMGVERSTIVFDENAKTLALLEKVKVKNHVEELLGVLN